MQVFFTGAFYKKVFLSFFCEKNFSSPVITPPVISYTEWTFQFAWLVVEPSVTVAAASELQTSPLLPLMKPVILRDQFTVIAKADKHTTFQWVIPWCISSDCSNTLWLRSWWSEQCDNAFKGKSVALSSNGLGLVVYF